MRLEGTEVEEGRKILAESGVKIITADGLTDAAKKVVAAVTEQMTNADDNDGHLPLVIRSRSITTF